MAVAARWTAARKLRAGGDGAELLELGEEVLNQVACLVEMPVVVPRRPPIGFPRDDCGLACGCQRLDDPLVGVERLIGDQRIGLHCGQEVVGADQIVGLAAGQEEAKRIAERIDQGMDLGAQSATRAADRLVFPDFFWAPALC
jgi:hypothetical protein